MKMKGENCHPKLVRVIAIINQSSSYISPEISTSSMILDTMFASREACSADSTNHIFGRRFGITCKINDRKWFIRRVTNDDMLHIYSISDSSDNYVISAQSDNLNELLPFRIPCTYWYYII